MELKPLHVAITSFAIVLLQAVILFLVGRPVICSCGYVDLWDGVVRGLQNSQMLMDWYSLSHIVYGIVLYAIASIVHKKFGWKFSVLFLLLLVVSFIWEIYENTAGIYYIHSSIVTSNYYGDSIINSLTDTLFMALGFGLAYKLPRQASLAIFLLLTAVTTIVLHDNVFLNIFNIFLPIPAVIRWQAAASIYH